MAINAAAKITKSEFMEFALPIFKAAAAAKIAGTNVTLTVAMVAKSRPVGWPRGVLLSVSEDEYANYSYNPEKILRWIEKTKEQLPD